MDGDGAWQNVKAKLIGDLGYFFEATGHNELMGRLVGLLAFAAKPLALTEMAKELGISKAAASIHLRTLRRFELVEKVTFPGDRSDYYILHADFAKGFFRATIRETQGLLQIFDRALGGIRAAMGGSDRAGQDRVAARLAELRAFLAGFTRALEELIREERLDRYE